MRVIRGADPGAQRDDWATATPEQRMNAVWELTRLCLLWNAQTEETPRLQRTVVRALRSNTMAPGRLQDLADVELLTKS